ncbi:MAG: hypothetical protein OEN02_07275 [Gammaproteobacteria bacterium]|nr:hypothetical protein [Gammaproteobacteria bacterium]MDH3535335.1 hypothetical protein [Gammaproteobacteria bacterium]
MLKSRLDRLLAPWVFVLTGILFNILSAVITHYFIGLNNDQISLLDREIGKKQVLIDSLWQSKTEVERKKEFFVLLLSSKPDNPSLAETFYHDYLRQVLGNYGLQDFETRMQQHDPTDLELLLDLSSAAQESIIASINNTYFESLELRDAKMPLEADNSRLFSIAIFLQVTGLILVLARDLRRR